MLQGQANLKCIQVITSQPVGLRVLPEAKVVCLITPRSGSNQ